MVLFVALIVLLIAGGAGAGHSIADTGIGEFALGVLLPAFAVAVVLSMLLALLNSIGVRYERISRAVTAPTPEIPNKARNVLRSASSAKPYMTQASSRT